jgi:hypothetical protein
MGHMGFHLSSGVLELVMEAVTDATESASGSDSNAAIAALTPTNFEKLRRERI